MTDPLVEVRDLEKYYFEDDTVLDRLVGREPTSVKAVDGVSFDIHEGETLGLVGESGCGKSTTGETLLNLRDPTGGDVRFDGESVFDLSGAGLANFRERAQVVFQDPFSSLDPRMTAGAIVAEPLRIHGVGDRQSRRETAAELLDQVGLSADQTDRYPHEFSGGQRQRIGIARALALEPDFLLLDEPVSALDVSVQAQILNLLEDLQDEYDLTYLFIAHDLSVVRHICDRVAVMYLGNVVEVGPTDEIFTAPRHPYTEALLDSVPRASTAERDREIHTLEGDVPSPRNPPSGCRFRTRCPQVIPPEELEIDQAEYRTVMDVRERIERRDLDLSYVREVAEEEDRAVVDVLAEQELETALAPTHRERVEAAFEAVAGGDWEGAAADLREHYESVCETTEPLLGREAHPAACHLYEQPADGAERHGEESAAADD